MNENTNQVEKKESKLKKLPSRQTIERGLLYVTSGAVALIGGFLVYCVKTAKQEVALTEMTSMNNETEVKLTSISESGV